tara:strand:- start:11931 stop:12143 length:213 start_codon:yes stop_codon:yes gene_type:complete
MLKKELQEFADALANSTYGGINNTDAVGVCVSCRQFVHHGVNMFTSTGLREFEMSGMCERCFDDTYGEDD